MIYIIIGLAIPLFFFTFVGIFVYYAVLVYSHYFSDMKNIKDRRIRENVRYMYKKGHPILFWW